MFLLKKIITQFFMPLPIVAGMLVVGLFLLWFTGRRRAAGVLLTAATLMTLIIGYGILCDSALAGLERRYPPLDIQAARNAGVQWVVVLAGGHVSSESLPVTSQLLHETQVRLIEGIRIHRSLPGAKLLVSGGSFLDPKASATLMAELACELGVDPALIVVEDESKDTDDEAALINPIVGRRRFILVTSAYHMPRSMALFKAQGMQPMAAPVGHLILDPDYTAPRSFFPGSDKIRNCEMVVHEALGIVHAYITGKLRQKEPEKRGEFSAQSLCHPLEATHCSAGLAGGDAGAVAP